jgi:hypothetical protein
MSAQHGKSTSVLVGKYDLSGYLNSVDWSRSCDTAETTVFGLNSKTYIPGLMDGSLSAAGLFDGAVGAVDEALAAALGTANTPVTFCLQGSGTQGNRVKLAQAIETEHTTSSPVDDVVATNASFQPSGGVWGGVVVEPLTAKVNAGNSAGSVDNAASTANGGIANLHVTSHTSGSGTYKVQHSTDNSVWVDLITFTAAAAATSEQKSVAGTINRYLRGAWTGTFSQTALIAFARQ